MNKIIFIESPLELENIRDFLSLAIFQLKIVVKLFYQNEKSLKIFFIFKILMKILQFIDHVLKLAHEQTKHGYSK